MLVNGTRVRNRGLTNTTLNDDGVNLALGQAI